LEHAMLLLELGERSECLVDIVVWQHHLDAGFQLQRPAPVADSNRPQHLLFQIGIANEDSEELRSALAGTLADDEREIGIGVAKCAGEDDALVVDDISLTVLLP